MAVYSYQWAEPVLKRHKDKHDDNKFAYCILNFVLPLVFTCVSWKLCFFYVFDDMQHLLRAFNFIQL